MEIISGNINATDTLDLSYPFSINPTQDIVSVPNFFKVEESISIYNYISSAQILSTAIVSEVLENSLKIYLTNTIQISAMIATSETIITNVTDDAFICTMSRLKSLKKPGEIYFRNFFPIEHSAAHRKMNRIRAENDLTGQIFVENAAYSSVIVDVTPVSVALTISKEDFQKASKFLMRNAKFQIQLKTEDTEAFGTLEVLRVIPNSESVEVTGIVVESLALNRLLETYLEAKRVNLMRELLNVSKTL